MTPITSWEDKFKSQNPSATFDPWKRMLATWPSVPCPGWYTPEDQSAFKITDIPTAMLYAFGGTDNPIKYFRRDFRITVRSSPGCPCEKNGKKNQMTLYARQLLGRELNRNTHMWEPFKPPSFIGSEDTPDDWIVVPPEGRWPAPPKEVNRTF